VAPAPATLPSAPDDRRRGAPVDAEAGGWSRGFFPIRGGFEIESNLNSFINYRICLFYFYLFNILFLFIYYFINFIG
jgi:hypothetical protein